MGTHILYTLRSGGGGMFSVVCHVNRYLLTVFSFVWLTVFLCFFFVIILSSLRFYCTILYMLISFFDFLNNYFSWYFVKLLLVSDVLSVL